MSLENNYMKSKSPIDSNKKIYEESEDLTFQSSDKEVCSVHTTNIISPMLKNDTLIASELSDISNEPEKIEIKPTVQTTSEHYSVPVGTMSGGWRLTQVNTQNELLMKNLMEFYGNREYLYRMMRIINGESNISLRIVDWFVTNYAKEYYTVYDLLVSNSSGEEISTRFKVYNDYKLKLKAYTKKRLDPFCRWERISIPYDNNNYMETTIGQLNFFKWAIETKIIEYIEDNYGVIERDMNNRNSTSKRRISSGNLHIANTASTTSGNGKTRKKREELSISACKCIKKENVSIVLKFN